MLKNVKASAVAAVLAVSSAAFSATPFQIKVDLNVVPEAGAPVMKVPAGAKAAVDRYFRFAERTHPLVLTHSYAARPDKKNKAVSLDEDDDPLGSLDLALVADDAVQDFDKDVEFVVRANKSRSSMVLMIVNRKKENMTAHVELKRGSMREPVYRRVYSEDGGKTWTTAAWQPPRESALYPWPLDVPANTIQTVTINLKQ